MAGLGRIQQRFNAAVVTILTLAGLGGMTGAKAAKEAALKGTGHPIHAKYLTSSDPKGNRSYYVGARYPGYCGGTQETLKRKAKLERKWLLPSESSSELF